MFFFIKIWQCVVTFRTDVTLRCFVVWAEGVLRSAHFFDSESMLSLCLPGFHFLFFFFFTIQRSPHVTPVGFFIHTPFRFILFYSSLLILLLFLSVRSVLLSCHSRVGPLLPLITPGWPVSRRWWCKEIAFVSRLHRLYLIPSQVTWTQTGAASSQSRTPFSSPKVILLHSLKGYSEYRKRVRQKERWHLYALVEHSLWSAPISHHQYGLCLQF